MSRDSLVVGWLLCSWAMSGSLSLLSVARAEQPAAPADLFPRSEARQQLEGVLTTSADLEFIDTELGQALTFLADRYQLRIIVDDRALGDLGVTLADPVTLTVTDVELRTALQLILEPRGLDLLIQDGVALVTSRDRVASTVETRVYVWDESGGVSAEQIAEVIRSSIRQDSWRSASTPMRNFAPWSSYPYDDYEDYTSPEPGSGLEGLMGGLGMAAAGTSTATDSSPDPNTSHPAISALPGGLVITQSQPAHREITVLLEQLRGLPARATTAESAPRFVEPESPFDTTTAPQPGLDEFPFTENFN